MTFTERVASLQDKHKRLMHNVVSDAELLIQYVNVNDEETQTRCKKWLEESISKLRAFERNVEKLTG